MVKYCSLHFSFENTGTFSSEIVTTRRWESYY